MKCLTLSAACLCAATAAPSAAAWADGRPTLVPIIVKVITGVPGEVGKRVYSIPVQYGSTTVQTVLDTGSMPTQVLPGQLKASDFSSTGRFYHQAYAFGGQYHGDVVSGTVAVGAVSAPAEFGVVTHAQCAKDKPMCPIQGEGPSQARFGGNSYYAILGAMLSSGQGMFNPLFRQLGVSRFLINAPPDAASARTGQLLLNPTANETSTYVPLTNYSASDLGTGFIRGCLEDFTAKKKYCGAVLPDTGTTGVTVQPTTGSGRGAALAAGDKARLTFTDASGAELARVDFVVQRTPTTGVFVDAASTAKAETVIFAGQLPYLGLHMLTDFGTGTYSVAARSDGGTVGQVP